MSEKDAPEVSGVALEIDREGALQAAWGM
jgi:hypothetical protein